MRGELFLDLDTHFVDGSYLEMGSTQYLQIQSSAAAALHSKRLHF